MKGIRAAHKGNKGGMLPIRTSGRNVDHNAKRSESR